jgi:hypothetical protein
MVMTNLSAAGAFSGPLAAKSFNVLLASMRQVEQTAHSAMTKRVQIVRDWRKISSLL